MAKSNIEELSNLVNQNKFNISTIIDNIVEESDAYSIIQSSSIQKIMSEVAENEKQANAFKNLNKIIDDAEKNGGQIEGARVALYSDYEDLLETIPVVENAINTYVDNIVSPDNLYEEFLKISHRFEANELPPIKVITSGCKGISEHIDIELVAEELTYNALVYGDSFAYIEESQTILAKKQYKVLLDSIEIKNNPNGLILCESMSDDNINKKTLTKEDTKDAIYSHIFNFLKDSNNILQPKLESVNITINNYNAYDVELDVNNIPEYKELLEAVSPDDNPEMLKKELLNELKLSQVKVVLPSPKDVLVIYAGKEILGYLILDIKEGDSDGGTIGTDIGNKMLKSIFANSNLENVKEIIDENPNFSNYITNLLKTYDNQVSSIAAKFVPNHLMVHISLRSGSIKKKGSPGTGFPYGKSHLNSIRELGKYTVVSQRANMLYRFMRAPELRIFKIDIGMDTDAAKYIQNVKREINQKQYAINPNMDLDTLSSNLTQFDTIWVPTKQGQEFFTVDQTPAGDLNSKMDDLKQMKDDVISGLRVPPVYLGLERPEDSRYTLSQMNAQFAASCKRYQRHINIGIEGLIKNIYILIYGNTPLLNSISIGLQPPTALMMERLSEIFTNISNIGQSINQLGIGNSVILSKFLPFISQEDIALDKIEKNIDKLKTGSDDGDNESGGGIF